MALGFARLSHMYAVTYYGSSHSLTDQENLFISAEPGALVVPG